LTIPLSNAQLWAYWFDVSCFNDILLRGDFFLCFSTAAAAAAAAGAEAELARVEAFSFGVDTVYSTPR
jgi:hypothetical protein